MNEEDANEEMNADKAIILSTESNCNSLLDYVKAVSALIGSSNIHSIHKVGNRIKLYVTEKRYVSTVINAGVVAKSGRTNAEFAIPLSKKVILSDIDPVIPDKYVEDLLQSYGIFESSVIRQKFADEEYCGIENGIRFIYMKIFQGVVIPNELSLLHEGIYYTVHIKVENATEEYAEIGGTGHGKFKVSCNKLNIGKNRIEKYYPHLSGNRISKMSNKSEKLSMKNRYYKRKKYKCKAQIHTSSLNNATLPVECAQQDTIHCEKNNEFLPKQSTVDCEVDKTVVSTQNINHEIDNMIVPVQSMNWEVDNTMVSIQSMNSDIYTSAVQIQDINCETDHISVSPELSIIGYGVYNPVLPSEIVYSNEVEIIAENKADDRKVDDSDIQNMSMPVLIPMVHSVASLSMFPEFANKVACNGNCHKVPCICETDSLYEVARINDIEAFINSSKVKPI